MPLPISQRFTGVVTTKATASEKASDAQKSPDEMPASMAPGTDSTTALSTTSMTAIDTVSAARANGCSGPGTTPGWAVVEPTDTSTLAVVSRVDHYSTAPVASTPGVLFRGGLAGGGLYVLALQLVVSALAISAIDDSRDPQLVDPAAESRWPARRSAPGTATFRLRRALWHFHLRHFLSACLLAWGLTTSLSMVAIGVLDRGGGPGVDGTFDSALPADRVRASEPAPGAVPLLTVLLTLRQRGAGRYGWVVGFATAVVTAQMTFSVGPDDEGAATHWIVFGAAGLTVPWRGSGPAGPVSPPTRAR